MKASCRECEAVIDSSTTVCPGCGVDFTQYPELFGTLPLEPIEPPPAASPLPVRRESHARTNFPQRRGKRAQFAWRPWGLVVGVTGFLVLGAVALQSTRVTPGAQGSGGATEGRHASVKDAVAVEADKAAVNVSGVDLSEQDHGSIPFAEPERPETGWVILEEMGTWGVDPSLPTGIHHLLSALALPTDASHTAPSPLEFKDVLGNLYELGDDGRCQFRQIQGEAGDSSRYPFSWMAECELHSPGDGPLVEDNLKGDRRVTVTLKGVRSMVFSFSLRSTFPSTIGLPPGLRAYATTIRCDVERSAGNGFAIDRLELPGRRPLLVGSSSSSGSGGTWSDLWASLDGESSLGPLEPWETDQCG